MEKFRAFLKRKNIVFSARRYGIDALGAMAQGLFCSLLDRYHHQNPGHAIESFLSFGHRLLRHGRLRPRHGRGHRLCPAGAAHGAVFPQRRGLGRQCGGRRRRPPGRADYRHRRRGMRQGRLARRPKSISWSPPPSPFWWAWRWPSCIAPPIGVGGPGLRQGHRRSHPPAALLDGHRPCPCWWAWP